MNAATNNQAATADYQTVWAGTIKVQVVAFKTTRRGEKVTRYRWSPVEPQAEFIYGVYGSVQQALNAKQLDNRFSNFQ